MIDLGLTPHDFSYPWHVAMRGALARLFLRHKADMGLADRPDADIVSRVDDIMVFMMKRHGNALLAGDSKWLDDFRWFADACDRLQRDQPAVPIDG